MQTLLASPLFRYLLFPLGSALLGIFIKVFTRNDKYTTFKKEDMAVGLNLMTTACITYVLVSTDRALQMVRLQADLEGALRANNANSISTIQHNMIVLSASMATAGGLIASMFIGLWAVSSIVRKWGWRSETELSPAIGIALPLVLGVLFLMVVMVSSQQ